MSKSKTYIFWKRLLSYRKKNWDFEDYPVEILNQGELSKDVPAYRAFISEWMLMGFGETEEDALNELKKNFENFLVNRPDEVPRPGTMMPVESYLSSHAGVDDHPETADKFIRVVLGHDPDYFFFISDESSLNDFLDSKNGLQDYIARTKSAFGVDISDIEDGNLLRIFEKIDDAGKQTDPA